MDNYHFDPLAFDALGGPGVSDVGHDPLTLGDQLNVVTGYYRSESPMLQRLSLDVQRGNPGTMRNWLANIKYMHKLKSRG